MSGNIPQNYRKNVAIVVLNEEGKILACRRSDKYKSWQLPQGGIDQGETLEQTLYRELKEEIGCDDVEVLAKLDQPIHYEWPEKEYHRGYRGQEQYYFLVRINPAACIDLRYHHIEEFDKYQWMGISEFLEIVSGFKKEAYKKALEEFVLLLPGIIYR